MKIKNTLLRTATCLLMADGLHGNDPAAPRVSCDSGCCSTPMNHDASDRSERQTHPLRGVIVDVLPGKKSILVKHEAIPGFMPAMTMLFRVDGATLAGLKKGQTITATLVTDEHGMMLTDVKVVAPSS